MTRRYDDIINLPCHVSTTRPRMPRQNRAAQFAPFSGLTGYDAALAETARRTDARIEPGEDAMAALDRKFRILAGRMDGQPEVAVTHFQPDSKKEGGAYVLTTGALKKIDEYDRAIVFLDGTRIAMEDILDLACEELKSLMEMEDAL